MHYQMIKPARFITAAILALFILSACSSNDDADSNSEALPIGELEPIEPLSETARALPSAQAIPPKPDLPEGPATELAWEDLIPEDYNPQQMMIDSGLMEYDDFDPRGQEIADELREQWDVAPLIPELDQTRVQLSGYVVPTEGFAQRGEVTEFLLVPYYGACIHVPPPPANQTVYVITPEPVAIPKMYAIVTVNGIMVNQRVGSDLAAAGYVIHAEQIDVLDIYEELQKSR